MRQFGDRTEGVAAPGWSDPNLQLKAPIEPAWPPSHLGSRGAAVTINRKAFSGVAGADRGRIPGAWRSSRPLFAENLSRAAWLSRAGSIRLAPPRSEPVSPNSVQAQWLAQRAWPMA